MGIGEQLSQFGEQLRQSIAVGAEGELSAAKQQYEMQQEAEKQKIREPHKLIQSLITDVFRADGEEARAQAMARYNDALDTMGPYFEWYKKYKEQIVRNYGDENGELPGYLGMQNTPLTAPSLDMVELLKRRPEESSFEGTFIQNMAFDVAEKVTGKRPSTFTAAKQEWDAELEKVAREHALKTYPDIDDAGLQAYTDLVKLEAETAYKKVQDNPEFNYEQVVPTDFAIPLAKGVKQFGKSQKTSVKSRDKAAPAGKIKVRNEKGETFLILKEDLEAAQKEGFKQVK